MAGGQSELERRAASIAAESMAALVAHHDTDGDSGDHSTAGHGASAFRKSASLHAAPASAGQIMKRMKIHASSTPAVESAHASPLKPAAMKGETCATNEPGCAPRRSSGSDSDGTSSSAPDPRKTAAQTPTPARKVRVRKPTYAVRKVRLTSRCCLSLQSSRLLDSGAWSLTPLSLSLAVLFALATHTCRKRRTCS